MHKKSTQANIHTTTLIVKRISCHHSKIFFIYSTVHCANALKHFISPKEMNGRKSYQFIILRLNYIAMYPIIVSMIPTVSIMNVIHLHICIDIRIAANQQYCKRFYYSAFLYGNKMSSCKRLKVQTFYKFVIHKVSK